MKKRELADVVQPKSWMRRILIQEPQNLKKTIFIDTYIRKCDESILFIYIIVVIKYNGGQNYNRVQLKIF